MADGTSLGSHGLAGEVDGASIATRGRALSGFPSDAGLTPFEARVGYGQGRIVPSAVAPAAGSYLFVLGHESDVELFDLRPGDRADIAQSLDVTTLTIVRADLRLVTPDGVPDGWAWQATILVDDVEMASAIGRPGRTRVLNDLAANVSKMTGIVEVKIRLELVET